MIIKVKQLEKDFFTAKKKIRASNGSMSSRNRDISRPSNKTYEDLLNDLNSARVVEKRLKEEMLVKDQQFDEERTHMRDIVKREKAKLGRYQEETLKAKDMYEKNKNKIIKEMIEKDEVLHQVTNELNEIKSQVRAKEIMKVENKLSEIKASKDCNISSYENMMDIKTSREFSRSKSPYLNENNTSETVMYGGGTSVIDSIIGLFPHERISVTTSNDMDFKSQDKRQRSKQRFGSSKSKSRMINSHVTSSQKSKNYALYPQSKQFSDLEDIQESVLH